PTAPAGVSVTVTTPSAVEKITVTAPVISVPTAPSDKNITVNAPATPAGFEPTTVTAPTAPETPTVIMPNIPDMSIGANTTGTGDNAWYWKANGDLGPINQINLTGGTFSARSASSIDSIYITNYTGAPTTTNGTANYASSEGSTADVNNGTATSSVGFYKWCGAPIIRMGSAVTINWEGAGANRRALLKNDVHGNQATVLSTLLSGTSAETITSAEYNYIASKIYPYHNHTNTGNTDGNGSLTATRIMYGANYGTWNLSGDYINGYEADGHNDSSTNRATVFHNYGTIQTLANSSRIALLAYGAENSGYRTFTSVNSGTMTINGKTSAIFAPNRSGTNHEINFLNYGKLVINGGNNVGLYISGSSDGGSTLFMDKPLEIYGDNNIGAYFLTAGFNLNGTNSDLKINIGVSDANVTNIAQSTLGTGNDTVLGQNPTLIEGNVGISSKFAKSLKNHEIKIGTQTKSNIGFYGGHTTGTFSLGTGNITIYGGQSNIGIYTDKGDVTSSGDITLSGGVGNMAVYSTAAGKTIQVNKINTANIEDSVVVYGANGTKITASELNVVSKVGANPTIANKKDTGAAFASGTNTVITFNRATTPAAANIDITGSKLDDADRYVGFGVMATGGGVVNAKNNYIKVTNGSTAAASIGASSNVDLSGGTVEFDGSGYAVYSDGVGKINLSNSKMILKGKATAFDVDMAGTLPITLDTNSRIHVESNDVVVFNLKNATGLSTNGLEASITTKLGTALGGANLSNLIVAGGGIDKYKIAAVDGGTITIGNLDKTGTGAVSDTQAQKDGNFYYNRFLGQRLVATATGSTISAVLDDTQALKFNNQVVGLEMNSSKSAVSNNEAGINLVGSTITADRDGSGLGAIGAFINYGVVTVDGTSSIKVEKESNTANNQAVGVYAVNGSTVSNAGDIKVGGDLSIGILGMAYREDSSNTPIVDEFGSLAAGQGKADITNTNKITLDGTGAVGIYAY
ncbi:beta strand repeat-containing protein, partial [Fusobacterium varium]|uniref:beta strand repeat-containing protein n=1 Tax=Fusobacterium varium TaxID=856 RepID=UPI00359C7517